MWTDRTKDGFILRNWLPRWRAGWHFSSSPKATCWQKSCCLEAFFFSLRVFNWLDEAFATRVGNLLCSMSTNLNTESSRIVFDQTCECCGPENLIHKINHHRGGPVGRIIKGQWGNLGVPCMNHSWQFHADYFDFSDHFTRAYVKLKLISLYALQDTQFMVCWSQFNQVFRQSLT